MLSYGPWLGSDTTDPPLSFTTTRTPQLVSAPTGGHCVKGGDGAARAAAGAAFLAPPAARFAAGVPGFANGVTVSTTLPVRGAGASWPARGAAEVAPCGGHRRARAQRSVVARDRESARRVRGLRRRHGRREPRVHSNGAAEPTVCCGETRWHGGRRPGQCCEHHPDSEHDGARYAMPRASRSELSVRAQWPIHPPHSKPPIHVRPQHEPESDVPSLCTGPAGANEQSVLTVLGRGPGPL